MDSEQLTAINQTAEQVGRAHAALDVAAAHALAARATMLREIIGAFGPSLRALASQIGRTSTTTSGGTTVEPFPWRGIYLAGDGPSTGKASEFSAQGGSRGRFFGTRLILKVDGSLVELSYDGPWSTVPGEVSKWTATDRAINDVEATKRYGLEGIFGELKDALRKAAQKDKATDGMERRAEKFNADADRVHALLTLIRSWR